MTFVLAFALLLMQTPPVQNPTAIEFTSVDHGNGLSGYEIDIVRVADGSVLQTLTVAAGQVPQAPTTDCPAPCIRVTLNVQPIAFGVYRGVVRAVSGALKSPSSVPSDNFERVPGRPGKPRTGS